MKITNKKGFSIAEVVIALAVISLVTITAISITSLSSSNTQTFLNKADAQYLVADAVVCFKVSDTADEFYDALVFRGGWRSYSKSDEGEQFYFIINNSGYLVQVKTNYSDQSENSLFIVVTNPANNNDIVAELTYRKAGR